MAAAVVAEPSSEPPAESGVAAQLRAAAEVALPPLRALLEDQGLLPQQALGILSFVADVLNRLLANLAEPEALAKFSRLKLSALRKKVTSKPKHAEAILQVAGFSSPGSTAEHLEWGPEGPDALAAALAVNALIAQVQELAQTKGTRAVASPIGAEMVTARAVVSATFGGLRLMEPRSQLMQSVGRSMSGAGANGEPACLVRRSWLKEHLPQLYAAQEELPSLFEPAAIFASRERAAKAVLVKAVNEARAARGLGDAAKLSHSPLLAELAQLAAGAELVRLRKPEMFKLAPPAPEPDVEPEGSTTASASGASAAPPASDDLDDAPVVTPSVSAEELIVPALARCIPAFRLGLPHAAMSDILRLAEAPAFFTMDEKEKAFQISLANLGERIVSSWLARPASGGALLRPEACAIGVGCALDIGNDDKAIIFVVLG